MHRRLANLAVTARLKGLASALLLSLLAGCAATPQSDRLMSGSGVISPTGKELVEVPFFPQEQYQCGPAALAAMLGNSNKEVTPDDLVSMVYVPDKKGSFQLEMLAATRRNGRIPYQIDPEMEDLVREVASGKPVLVLQNLGLSWYPQWHYAVVVGYDLERGNLILRSGAMERRATRFKVFENTWRRGGYWGFVVLKPGELPVTADPDKYFLALAPFVEKGESGQVIQALQAGVQRWPENQPLGMALANFYYAEGQLAEAAETYLLLIDRYPNYAPAHNNLALVLKKLEETQKAVWHAKQAVLIGGRFKEQYRKTLDEVQAGL